VLKHLARWSYAHRRLVVLAWILLLVGSQLLASVAGGTSSMDFKLPKSDSQAAQDLLARRFKAQSGASATIVFADPAGLDTPATRPRIAALVADASRVPDVEPIVSPFDARGGRRQVSADGTVAFAQVNFGVAFSSVKATSLDQLRALANKARTDGLDVELGGNLFQVRKPPGGTELVGVLAAVLILLLAFGSLLAMGLPIMTALFGIGIGLAGVTLLANVFSMPAFASQLAAMIGIGVGIDYALFIVTRFRQGLHDGLAPEAAVVKSIATAGKAVLFAGCTVVISLLGMFAMGLGFVRGLAVGAALAVVVTMIASVTLLPAVLGFVGLGIDKLALPWTKRATAGRRGFWYRWSRLIQRRPWPFAVLGLAALVTLAIPVFSIRLGNSDAGNLPRSDTTRVAYDLLGKGFGPGFNGPLLLAIEAPTAQAAAALPGVHDAVARTPGVKAVTPASLGPDGKTAVMQVYPTTGPQDQATVSLIHHLRKVVVPAAIAGTGLVVHVGGNTAAFNDLADFLGSHLPIFMLVVLGLSFLLLMAVFRSIVVPLKAVVMNVLSIGAAYGLLVAVFQWGIGAHLIGVGNKGPIEAFVPMMMFAILFGLSMDYEVFLLSRVKEEWDKTRDNGTAVADGLSYTARVITAAAAIMVCVFGSFVFGDNRIIKEFGLGLAAAILIDATLVRMILVPATMELLGDANWWFPRWLDRMVPKIHIEAGDDDVAADDELAGMLEQDELIRR
jgi:putative drug exporter of the RND superfamily